jgi:multidrug efflux pump subunit AcrB
VGKSYFPRTDPAQFVINLKAPTGTRLEITDQIVGQIEQIVRSIALPVPQRWATRFVRNRYSGGRTSTRGPVNSGHHHGA